jgi:hypothetical protein
MQVRYFNIKILWCHLSILIPRPVYLPKELQRQHLDRNSLVPPSGLLPALIIPSGAATSPADFQMECCHQRMGQDAWCLRSSMQFFYFFCTLTNFSVIAFLFLD